MGAHRLPQTLMAAFTEQVEVHVAHRGQVAVGVILRARRAVFGDRADAVVGNTVSIVGFHGRHNGDKDTVVLRLGLRLAVLGDDRHRLGLRSQYTDRARVLVLAGAQMASEDFVGVVEGSMAHCVQLIVVDGDDGLNVKCIVCHVMRISQSRRSRGAFCVN